MLSQYGYEYAVYETEKSVRISCPRTKVGNLAKLANYECRSEYRESINQFYFFIEFSIQHRYSPKRESISYFILFSPKGDDHEGHFSRCDLCCVIQLVRSRQLLYDAGQRDAFRHAAADRRRRRQRIRSRIIAGEFLHPVFFGLPNNPSPNTELALGQFTAGTSIDFGIETQFGGEYFAFSNETTPAAIRAFTDIDNSLGLGGNVVESTGLNTYVLHLDDAASFMVDDNDADILMQLRAVPGAVPEPSSLGILAFGAAHTLRRVLADRRGADR